MVVSRDVSRALHSTVTPSVRAVVLLAYHAFDRGSNPTAAVVEKIVDISRKVGRQGTEGCQLYHHSKHWTLLLLLEIPYIYFCYSSSRCLVVSSFLESDTRAQLLTHTQMAHQPPRRVWWKYLEYLETDTCHSLVTQICMWNTSKWKLVTFGQYEGEF